MITWDCSILYNRPPTHTGGCLVVVTAEKDPLWRWFFSEILDSSPARIHNMPDGRGYRRGCIPPASISHAQGSAHRRQGARDDYKMCTGAATE